MPNDKISQLEVFQLFHQKLRIVSRQNKTKEISTFLFSLNFLVVPLRRLILANNNLSGLPPAIRFLVNLEYLDLSRNPLRVKNGLDDYDCLPKEFASLKKTSNIDHGRMYVKTHSSRCLDYR